MSKEFITIQDAAELSKKSIQTIRRAIKAKRLKFKRKSTPQGFNYLINYASLCEQYKLSVEEPKKVEKKEKVVEKAESVKAEVEKVVKAETDASGDTMTIAKDDFNAFAMTMERLINQHNDERRNFLSLVNTLQEKIFVLENQLNLLQEPKRNWYQFWK